MKEVPLRAFLGLLLVPLLCGCATRLPVYSELDLPRERAFVKLSFINNFSPITVGQVLIYEGAMKCETQLPAPKILFVRGRGNPLVADQNMDGVWIPAGKPVFLVGRGITSVSHNCATSANFMPRDGVRYELRLSHMGGFGAKDACVLEAYDESVLDKPSQDLATLKCEAK